MIVRCRPGIGAACALVLIVTSSSVQAQVAVRADVVHTMAGPTITDGVVLIRNGRIERVGPAASVQVPRGYREIRARVVTPGLVDAHTVVGVSGYLNQPHDQDQVESSAPMQPELRAVDAYNPEDKLVEWVRELGVTTMQTGHGPGALISGQTMVVKPVYPLRSTAILVPEAMVAATLGEDAFGSEGKPPGTRSKAVAMLRAELLKAMDYASKLEGPEDKRPTRDLRQETLARVMRKQLPLMITAHRSVDILAALRLAKEFDIRVVLDGAAEAHLLVDEIKAAGVPVIVHPTMYRSTGSAENLTQEAASILRRAGIHIALQSGFEGYVPKTRVLLFEAAVAAARGLTFDEALATVTIDAARLLGVDKRVGSLEAGKDADIVLYDGDPFEYTSHVVGVFIDGEQVSTQVR
ncbi:MAG: amidohydrolase family protein [Acidobacteriota bacterium]|nr:amidohydrolase family protein [Acidobacteriota bacterium]